MRQERFSSTAISIAHYYVDMPFIPVADTAKSVEAVNQHADSFRSVDIGQEHLTGVAATV